MLEEVGLQVESDELEGGVRRVEVERGGGEGCDVFLVWCGGEGGEYEI